MPDELETSLPLNYKLVGKFTVRDYKAVRDLKLLIWNLRKELCGKYEVQNACKLADKLTPMVEKRIAQLMKKTGKK